MVIEGDEGLRLSLPPTGARDRLGCGCRASSVTWRVVQFETAGGPAGPWWLKGECVRHNVAYSWPAAERGTWDALVARLFP